MVLWSVYSFILGSPSICPLKLWMEAMFSTRERFRSSFSGMHTSSCSQAMSSKTLLYPLFRLQIHKVPSTDMEALKSPLMGLFEKRRAGKFFLYVQDYKENDPSTHKGLDLTKMTSKELISWVPIFTAACYIISHVWTVANFDFLVKFICLIHFILCVTLFFICSEDKSRLSMSRKKLPWNFELLKITSISSLGFLGNIIIKPYFCQKKMFTWIVLAWTHKNSFIC